MKMLAFGSVGTQAWQKEDWFAHLVDLLEADTRVPRDCLPAATDDRVGLRKRAMGGRLRSTEVDQAAEAAAAAAVVVVVAVVC